MRARDFLPEQSSSRDYFANHPTGKQLALIMSLPRERPALYLDADVLFFLAQLRWLISYIITTPPALYCTRLSGGR